MRPNKDRSTGCGFVPHALPHSRHALNGLPLLTPAEGRERERAHFLVLLFWILDTPILIAVRYRRRNL